MGAPSGRGVGRLHEAIGARATRSWGRRARALSRESPGVAREMARPSGTRGTVMVRSRRSRGRRDVPVCCETEAAPRGAGCVTVSGCCPALYQAELRPLWTAEALRRSRWDSNPRHCSRQSSGWHQQPIPRDAAREHGRRNRASSGSQRAQRPGRRGPAGIEPAPPTGARGMPEAAGRSSSGVGAARFATIDTLVADCIPTDKPVRGAIRPPPSPRVDHRAPTLGIRGSIEGGMRNA